MTPAFPHASATTLWIRDPLAAFTANNLDASGGLVIHDGIILEVLAAGQRPSARCTAIFDAGNHVLLPGLINTHHHFYQTLTRAWGPGCQRPAVSLAPEPLPVVGPPDAAGP